MTRPPFQSKKRGPFAGSAERPSKKVALSSQAAGPRVAISFLPTKDEWSTVVASTPGLSILSSICLKPFKRQLVNAPKRPSNVPTSDLLLHSASHPKLDYTARAEEAGSTDTLAKHYIGVYDSEKGVLEVVEARKMVLRGTLRGEAVTVDKEKQHLTNIVLRQDLGRTFGTKKAQKAIASLTENAISAAVPGTASSPSQSSPSKPDALTTAVLSSLATTTSTMATRPELDAAIDAGKPRPKPNLSATTPAAAYPLSHLVSDDELRVLPVRDWQDAVSRGDDIPNLSSRFVARRIPRLAAASQTSGDAIPLKLLRYTLLLLDFHASLRSGGKVATRRLPKRDDLKAKLGAVPDFLLESVKRRFCTGATITKFQHDLLLTTLACLTLHIDGFVTDTSDLKEDLRLDNKEMSTYFQELGCKVAGMSEGDRKKMGLKEMSKAEMAGRRVARLGVPPELPKVRARVAKGKGARR